MPQLLQNDFLENINVTKMQSLVISILLHTSIG